MESPAFLEKIAKDKRKQAFAVIGKAKSWKGYLGSTEIDKALDKMKENEQSLQGECAFDGKYQFKVNGAVDQAKKIIKEVFDGAKKPFDAKSVVVTAANVAESEEQSEEEEKEQEVAPAGQDQPKSDDAPGPPVKVDDKIKKQVAEILKGNETFLADVERLCAELGKGLSGETPPEVATKYRAAAQKIISHLQVSMREMKASRAKIQTLAQRIA